MECLGSVPEEWNCFILAFGWDQKMEWNGSIMHLVGGIEEQNVLP
jgi:hypothetical protein